MKGDLQPGYRFLLVTAHQLLAGVGCHKQGRNYLTLSTALFGVCTSVKICLLCARLLDSFQHCHWKDLSWDLRRPEILNGRNMNISTSTSYMSPTVSTSNGPGRFNGSQGITAPERKETYHAVLIIISIVTIVINSYTLCLFARKRELRRKSNLLLVSLAVIDLLTGGINIPLVIYRGMTLVGNKPNWELLVMLDTTSVCCAAVTMLSLYSVVVDRFISLCHPLTYTSWVTTRKIVAVITFNWLASIIISYIRLWLSQILRGTFSSVERQNATKSDRIYYITGCCLYLVLIITLPVSFIRMFIVIRRLRRNEQKNRDTVSSEAVSQASIKREIKVVLVFAATYFSFLVCWTPLVVCRLLLNTRAIKQSRTVKQALDIVTVIRFLTPVIDPLLYTFFKYDTYTAALEDYKYLSLKVNQFFQRTESADTYLSVTSRNRTYGASASSVLPESKDDSNSRV